MCNPAILVAAGSAVSAASQIQGAAYASQMASYRAQVAQQNKARTHEAAMDAIAEGQDQQRQLGREVAGRVGAQAARMGANNVDVGFGSAARTIADTRMIGGEDSDALSRNILERVKSYQSDMWNFESEKRAARAEAKQSKTAGMFAAATTILGGATQYADFRSRMKNP